MAEGLQYCRYCAFCFMGDVYYCSEKSKELTESSIKRVNKCHDFVLSDLGDVDSGKAYSPRKKKQCKFKQITIFEVLQ